MKNNFTLILIFAIAKLSFGRGPIINEWILNTTGKTASYWENVGPNQFEFHTTNVLADVLEVCYNNDYVYIESEGMTNDMGQFMNPGAPSAQGFKFKFSRNPSAGSGNEEVQEVASIGTLVNGIAIFGLGDGNSYNASTQENSPMGDGVWVGSAYYTEGFTLDTAFTAHPQAAGVYHSHATPLRLYSDPSNMHSPIVGFAHDGYPIYGPFGFSSAMDNTSGISRMTSSYQLRNITTRTTLPDGSNANPPGPAVTNGGDFDLGSYIQDYEYINGLGTLDEHNGRFCVTPQYPNGTYAYFVTVDASGTPQFPFYIGTTYYGTPIEENVLGNATIPSNGLTCLSLTTGMDNINTQIENLSVAINPNPIKDFTVLSFPEEAYGNFDIKIIDGTGKLVYAKYMVDSNRSAKIDLSDLKSGVYFVRVIGYNQLFTSRVIKE